MRVTEMVMMSQEREYGRGVCFGLETRRALVLEQTRA